MWLRRIAVEEETKDESENDETTELPLDQEAIKHINSITFDKKYVFFCHQQTSSTTKCLAKN